MIGARERWILVILLGLTGGMRPAFAQPLQPPPPLAPPGEMPPVQPTMPPPVAPGGTERTLREADEQDAGRGLSWVWVEPEIGAQFVALRALHDQNFSVGNTRTQGIAPVVGLGAGVQLLYFTLGLRGRMAFLPDSRYGTLNLEATYRVPFGNLEPYGMVSAGYATVFGLHIPDISLAADPSVRGVNGRIGGGVDYYLLPSVSVGLAASFEVMWLHRGAGQVVNGGGPTADANVVADARRSGTSVGFATGLTAVGGVHF